MGGYVIHRPEPAAMERALADNAGNAAGAILRLAWQAGLLREEIRRLTWDRVDLGDGRLLLPDRTVPLSGELASWLEELRRRQSGQSETVVLSYRDQQPLTPQSISRLARLALDAAGQRQVRLIDLRHDWILRQLGEHDWQYVSRIAGVEAAALHSHFAAWLEDGALSTRARRAEARPPLDEFALWKLLQAERSTPAGAALWLTWQLGLRLEEIVALRWEQVDREVLRLPGRTVPLTSGAAGVLRDLRAASPAAEYVLTTPRGGRPYDRTRLSKLARAALVRAGLDDVTLRDLRLDCDARLGGEAEVTAWLRRTGSITRRQAAELLGVSPTTAYHRLKQMVCRGRVVQVGARYYLPGSVVPPERQAAEILAYLSREGFAYRQDIARLLRIDPRQCRPILRRMVAAGQIAQQRQRYVLKKQA